MATILIIEDNANNFRLMDRILQRYKYQILHAETGEAGIEMAFAHRPDLILLDLGLPDVDGQTIAGMLKQPEGLPDTPLIVVTAWPQETARQMVDAYGCEGYIPKPIDTRAFAAQVATFLGSSTG
jgi:two-component system cell cycle response regulator DivK